MQLNNEPQTFMRLVAVCALSIPVAASADEILIHGFTWHGNSAYDTDCDTGPCMRSYNSVNPGISYVSSKGLMLGTFRNSYYKQSVYLGYRYMFDDNFGIFGALATGYRGRGSGGLIGGLVARTPVFWNGWRIGVAGQPIQTNRLDGVVSLHVSKEF